MTMTINKTKHKLVISSESRATIQAIQSVISSMPIKGEYIEVESLIPNLIPNTFSLVFKLNTIEAMYIRESIVPVARAIAFQHDDTTLTVEEIEIEVL